MNELLTRAFDEPLDDADESALAELLKRDDDALLSYLRLAHDEALLAEAVAEARASLSLKREIDSPRSRGSVAAALLLAALTLFLSPPSPSPSPLQPLGRGLLGEYFDGPELARPRASRIDAFLDFHWSVRPPDPAVAPGPWSARWSGTLRPRLSGPHALHVASDDGCRLWVDERLVLDHWRDQTRTERSVDVELAAERPVALRLEYFNREGPGSLRLAWTEPGRAKEPVPPDVLFPAPAGGSGLKAEIFDGLESPAPVLTRVDPLVDFAWGLGGPGPTDNFRVVWSGALAARRSGPMTLSVVSDDGCRLWVDGRLLIDDWSVRGTAERSATVELSGGRRVPLRLEYFDRVSAARCSLFWAGAEQPRELVPTSCLYPE